MRFLAIPPNDSVFGSVSVGWGINGGEMDKMKKWKMDPPLSLIKLNIISFKQKLGNYLH